MRNQLLDAGTARDIDKLVDRVHRELGNPERILELATVRDLLELDLRYYTVDDPGLMEEVVHKMRVGAKQIIKRPALLLEAVKTFDLKGLFLPDRKRILLDASIPDLKKRWCESHEIMHSLVPWHKDYLLGDTKETLSPGCHQQLEGEANYGAGRLIFPHKPMLELARSSAPSIAHVRAIASHFGNTITSTLWRYIEYFEGPCLGIIGEHPHHLPEDAEPIAYFIRSAKFETHFSSVTEIEVFKLISGYCAYRKSGPLGNAEITLHDANGAPHIFSAETFGNKYQVLTLITYLKPVEVTVASFPSVVASVRASAI